MLDYKGITVALAREPAIVTYEEKESEYSNMSMSDSEWEVSDDWSDESSDEDSSDLWIVLTTLYQTCFACYFQENSIFWNRRLNTLYKKGPNWHDFQKFKKF